MAHKRQEEGRENDATTQMAPGPSHVRAGSDSDVCSVLQLKIETHLNVFRSHLDMDLLDRSLSIYSGSSKLTTGVMVQYNFFFDPRLVSDPFDGLLM